MEDLINKIFNEDNAIGMKRIPDNSIDVILTDPPYLYLKNQKLDKPFDEQLFFSECKRVLKDSGFIVLFGRGTSFYRWNTLLADMKFNFKEEVVWGKCYTSSPCHKLHRVHETVSIHSKGKGVINLCRIPVMEKYKCEPEKLQRILERLATAFGNRKTFQMLKKYYDTGSMDYTEAKTKHNITRSEKSNVGTNRTVLFAKGLEEGILEQSIIREARDHYNTIHPTQKPAKLLERLLALVSKEGDVILDPFIGSGSTAVACINTNRKYIGFEIDKEYYYSCKERVDKEKMKPKQQCLTLSDVG